MKLFLASSIKDPKAMELLDEYSGGLKGKKIGYIPTASNGELPWDAWKSGGTWKAANSVGADVEVILLEDYENINFQESLADKDIIWMAGGASSYLMYWIKRTSLDVHLPRLLKNGMLYVGSSAGSMVTAPTLNTAQWYIGTPDRVAEYLPGLSLVDFDFYPHYEDKLYDEVIQTYRGKKLYLVKDSEVIIVEHGAVKVMGETRLIKL